MSITEEVKQLLIKQCLEARKMAYAPYSNYLVGAALLTEDGKIYKGCNIENSSYGGTICAERCAIFKAVSEGHKKMSCIAICGGKDISGGGIDQKEELAFPCGICRQVLREFCEPDKMIVIICKSENKYQSKTLEELLPNSFGPEYLLK